MGRKGIGPWPKLGTKGCYQKEGTRGQSALDADGEKNNSTTTNNNKKATELKASTTMATTR
jgi:hypothetical protein